MTTSKTTRRSLLLAGVGTGLAAAAGAPPGPAPAASGAPETVRSSRIDAYIDAEDGRTVRISTWAAWGARRGLILFSHGALSAPEKYERVIGPWNAAGFEVKAPLHVDSTDHPDHAKFGMLDSWRARLLDMRALSAFAGAEGFVAAGHSYGGLMALTLGGAAAEIPSGLKGPLRDPRATLVVAFSPPGPSPGLVSLAGYGTLAVPAFVQTGDRDVPFGSKDGRWQVHLSAFDAAPAGDKYGVVLQGVDHYFGGLICNFAVPGPLQHAQLTAAVSLSTLFIDACGTQDDAARGLLNQTLTQSGPMHVSRK